MKRNAGAEQLLRIINQLIFLGKNNALTYGDNLKLYPSEIHLLLTITNGKSENYNVIVKHLGVTKGAVSQTISRLVKKGILEKKTSGGKSDLMIQLTDLGKKVQKKCVKIQEAVQDRFASYMDSLSADDRRVIGEFLDHVEKTLGIQKQE
ncbi:MAG TPA: MarR family transcriptional regulator [Spirochaetota bacterium]|nr:MarR family transcriptional regulator [Spirochaetota bacterium]HQF10427.1 MarR family transcriptional regulator [Spirochaetota bacterium]